MKRFTQSAVLLPILTIAFVGAGAAAGYASLANADTSSMTTTTNSMQQMHPQFDDGNHVHGTVTAISGTTLTVTNERSSTTYTVDDSSASVQKFTAGSGPSSATIADIAVGDIVGIRGTVSGTSVVAQDIMDGIPERGGMMMHGRGDAVMGTVSAIHGSTITVTSPKGDTYTIDAGNADVTKTVSGTLSDVVVGETIGVHGSVNGTTVTADHIMAGLPQNPHAGQ